MTQISRVRLLQHLPHLPLIFVILLLVTAVFFIHISYNHTLDDDPMAYGWVVLSRTMSIWVVQIAAINCSVVYVYVVAAILSKKFSQRQRRRAALVAFLSMIAVPLSCWGSLHSFTEGGTSFMHIHRAHYDNRLYQLAFISNPHFGQSSYNLYACDDFGFMCDRVYVLDTSTGTPYENLGDYEIAKGGVLVNDLLRESLSIIIGGVRVYEYRR